MAYQSWGVAYDHCEAYLSTLVRIEGRLSKGHDGKVDNPSKGQGRLLPLLYPGHSRGSSAALFPGAP